MLVAASPAFARLATSEDAGLAYMEARAAAISGDHARSADLLGALAQAAPQDSDLARKALTEALGAGNIPLALKLTSNVAPAKLPIEARLLLVTEAVRQHRTDRALQWLQVKGDTGDLSFLSPLIIAWDNADRGQADAALKALDAIPNNSLLTPLLAEERALILLKFKRTAEAEPYARRAIGAAAAREARLRFALADGFLAAGDRARAQIMLDGLNIDSPLAVQRIKSGKPSGQAIDSSTKALGEVLTAFAADVARIQRVAPPIGMVEVARYANPQSSSTAMLLALLLNNQDRTDEALATLQPIPRDDALIGPVRDIQVKILSDANRYDAAYAIAAPAAAAPTAGASDFSRLGDLLQAMKRSGAAADAYGRAVALDANSADKSDLWSLLLLQADALQAAGRWNEARTTLERALVLAPDQPLLLNFLGYGKLERGEDVDAAEAMIRKASELAPDDASITDSLGWAEFKRGKVTEAISTLQRAAEKDPDQAEIQEHLGDALFRAGRRMEARFAWSAALVTAEDDIAARVKAKLQTGLTGANGAP